MYSLTSVFFAVAIGAIVLYQIARVGQAQATDGTCRAGWSLFDNKQRGLFHLVECDHKQQQKRIACKVGKDLPNSMTITMPVGQYYVDRYMAFNWYYVCSKDLAMKTVLNHAEFTKLLRGDAGKECQLTFNQKTFGEITHIFGLTCDEEGKKHSG